MPAVALPCCCGVLVSSRPSVCVLGVVVVVVGYAPLLSGASGSGYVRSECVCILPVCWAVGLCVAPVIFLLCVSVCLRPGQRCACALCSDAAERWADCLSLFPFFFFSLTRVDVDVNLDFVPSFFPLLGVSVVCCVIVLSCCRSYVLAVGSSCAESPLARRGAPHVSLSLPGSVWSCVWPQSACAVVPPVLLLGNVAVHQVHQVFAGKFLLVTRVLGFGFCGRAGVLKCVLLLVWCVWVPAPTGACLVHHVPFCVCVCALLYLLSVGLRLLTMFFFVCGAAY